MSVWTSCTPMNSSSVESIDSFIKWRSVRDMLTDVFRHMHTGAVRDFLLEDHSVDFIQVFASPSLHLRCVPYHVKITSPGQILPHMVFECLLTRVYQWEDIVGGFEIKKVGATRNMDIDTYAHSALGFRRFFLSLSDKSRLSLNLLSESVEISWHHIDDNRTIFVHLEFDRVGFSSALPLETAIVDLEKLEMSISKTVVGVAVAKTGIRNLRQWHTPLGIGQFQVSKANQSCIISTNCFAEASVTLPTDVSNNLQRLAVSKAMSSNTFDFRSIASMNPIANNIRAIRHTFPGSDGSRMYFLLAAACVNQNIEGVPGMVDTADLGYLVDRIIESVPRASAVPKLQSTAHGLQQIHPGTSNELTPQPLLSQAEAKILRRKLQKRASAQRSYQRKKIQQAEMIESLAELKDKVSSLEKRLSEVKNESNFMINKAEEWLASKIADAQDNASLRSQVEGKIEAIRTTMSEHK